MDIISVTVNGIDSESAEIDCQEAFLQVVWGTDRTTTHIYSRDAAYFDGIPWWLQGPNECDTLFEDVEFPRGYANQLTVTIRARNGGGQLIEGSRTVTVMGSWTYNRYDFQNLELAPIAPPAPPDKPALVNPPNGATFSTDTAIELQWSAADRATQLFVSYLHRMGLGNRRVNCQARRGMWGLLPRATMSGMSEHMTVREIIVGGHPLITFLWLRHSRRISRPLLIRPMGP